MKILIAAAGTGGHINPGISIANKIKEENPKAKIVFIGTDRGLENDLVPRAGYELEKLDVYGFSKEISINNVKKMLKTLKGFSQAKNIINKHKPDIVIGTGGYICGPICYAAIKYNIPVVLHESNAYPGMAIKMLSKKVNKILVGFEEAKDRLTNAKCVVVTGTPTKFKRLKLSNDEVKIKKQEIGLKNNLPLVLVFGGSQGAKAINETIIDIIEKKMNSNYQILWASGPKQYDIIKEELENKKININNINNVKILPYIYNMEEIMQISDLIVSRSGAMTITEISISGKPAIFVPLPSKVANRQEDNARAMEKIGAAKVILNEEINSEVLNKTINEMIYDSNELKNMGKKAKKVTMENVENRIYNEIKEYIEKVH